MTTHDELGLAVTERNRLGLQQRAPDCRGEFVLRRIVVRALLRDLEQSPGAAPHGPLLDLHVASANAPHRGDAARGRGMQPWRKDQIGRALKRTTRRRHASDLAVRKEGDVDLRLRDGSAAERAGPA
jgi:hypothetical protein